MGGQHAAPSLFLPGGEQSPGGVGAPVAPGGPAGSGGQEIPIPLHVALLCCSTTRVFELKVPLLQPGWCICWMELQLVGMIYWLLCPKIEISIKLQRFRRGDSSEKSRPRWAEFVPSATQPGYTNVLCEIIVQWK